MVHQKSITGSARWLLALGCSFIVGVGCKTVEPQPFSEETINASYAPFKGLRVGSESLSHYVQKRTAFLLSGVDLPETTEVGGTTFNGNATSSGKVYYGSAAAVDRSGYFITAAHCVEDHPEMLRLVFHNKGAVEVKEARVVYMGSPNTDGSDFAVVHVPVSLSHVFEWGRSYAAGDQILCSGSRQKSETASPSFQPVLSGGSIKEVGAPAGGGNRFQLIRHSAPIFHGNSGGPAVAISGRLLAVNFSATFSNRAMRKPSMKYSSAIRPDLNWLRQIIEKDSQTQNW